MTLNKKQNGFSIVEMLIAVVVVVVIGALGYVAYDRFIVNNKSSEVVEQSPVADDVGDVDSVPVVVESSDDLNEIEGLLDGLDTSAGDDSALIDGELDNF